MFAPCVVAPSSWRQALALVFTFASSQLGAQGVLQALLCLLFVVAHASLAPMRSPEANALQTVLLACLCMRGVVGAATQAVAAAGAVLHSDTATYRWLRDTLTVVDMVLPGLAIAGAYCGRYVCTRVRACARASR